MKKLVTPARIIFGLVWVIFSLNFFFQFLPMPPPSEKMAAFAGALFQTGYFFQFVKITELVVGVLLLVNLFVPLALVVIAPITINIFLVHTLLDPSGAPMAIALVALNVFLGVSYLQAYRPMLKAKA